MNAASSAETGTWSARRWLGMVLLLFAVQAGLLLYVSQPTPPPPVRPGLRTSVHLVTDTWHRQQLAELPGATDPTLLALPSRQSFSGPAWMQPWPIDYEPEPWSEAPRWLAPDAPGLGIGLVQHMATNVLTPPTIADKPAPPMLRYEPNFPSDPLPGFSSLRVEGPLARRPLVGALALPSWPGSELLSNTVVQVVVDADGFTFSAEPLAGSGQAEADHHALKQARLARFQPLPRGTRDATGRGPMAWGQLVFRWHTLPPAVTNVPAVLP